MAHAAAQRQRRPARSWRSTGPVAPLSAPCCAAAGSRWQTETARCSERSCQWQRAARSPTLSPAHCAPGAQQSRCAARGGRGGATQRRREAHKRGACSTRKIDASAHAAPPCLSAAVSQAGECRCAPASRAADERALLLSLETHARARSRRARRKPRRGALQRGLICNAQLVPQVRTPKITHIPRSKCRVVVCNTIYQR